MRQLIDKKIVTILIALNFGGCVSVRYPDMQISRLAKTEESQHNEQRIAVMVAATEVHSLSLAGEHDNDPVRAEESRTVLQQAITLNSDKRKQFHLVDERHLSANDLSAWESDHALITTWIQQIVAERYTKLEKDLNFTDSRKNNWDGFNPDQITRTETKLDLEFNQVIAYIPRPEYVASELSLPLDWPRWQQQFQADQLLLLFSHDRRATPDRTVAAMTGGVVAGAGLGLMAAGACVPDNSGGNGNVVEAFFFIACAMVTVPIGVLNGIVVLPERLGGEQRLTAALIDLHSGQLLSLRRALLKNDSDDVKASISEVSQLMRSVSNKDEPIVDDKKSKTSVRR